MMDNRIAEATKLIEEMKATIAVHPVVTINSVWALFSRELILSNDEGHIYCGKVIIDRSPDKRTGDIKANEWLRMRNVAAHFAKMDRSANGVS